MKKPFAFRILLFTSSLFFAFCFSLSAQAQEYVFDQQYFVSVEANQAVRSSAESTHDQYLGKINNNIQDVNINVGSVVLAETIIYNDHCRHGNETAGYCAEANDRSDESQCSANR
ncbi:hypothetical protein [Mucilaginibacter gotjawali]|uniref:Uncharacterized protein n=2 Tax=Mucilaginibacter gotjawali TaxID=1550579 RepID=A0A839SQM3_9SPHI|nr:hypothetical protein [Mucilaginibacter gotjawali]MBB3058759.1 hypothetical protein [Mucilaginibacter gotjawali]BAU55638.1 hypothetical protein MgSA37_03829 [Mucilaginibacter gotjawali]